MNGLPTIIGLTLNYRDAARTATCVHSLLGEGAAHVLVWDNSEDSGSSAQALQARLAGESRVTVEISAANLGFAAGVNRGLEWIARQFPGAWVLLLNNDACLLPGAIAALSTALMQHPQAKLAYPDIDHGGTVKGTVYYQRWFGLLSTCPLPGSFAYPSGCALLLAPERFDQPVFDEDFFMYGEDWLLGWNLRAPSGAMIHVAQILVHHEGSASSGLGSPFYETRLVAAHLILARKLAQNLQTYAVHITGRLLMLALRALIRALRYRSTIPLRAVIDGYAIAHGSDRIRQGTKVAVTAGRKPN